MFLPERPDVDDDFECFHLHVGSARGHLCRREANWERRESSVSDSVALDTMTTPQPAWMSDHGRRAMLSRQDAVSCSGSSNTDSTPRLQSPPDGCASPPWLLSTTVYTLEALSRTCWTILTVSDLLDHPSRPRTLTVSPGPPTACQRPPWLLSPGVPTSPALSPLWTGSGLPPPPSWTLRSPCGGGLRPMSKVQRSVSSASSRAKPDYPGTDYAGWSYDKLPAAATRHTANSQPSVSTQRQTFRPRDHVITL